MLFIGGTMGEENDVEVYEDKLMDYMEDDKVVDVGIYSAVFRDFLLKTEAGGGVECSRTSCSRHACIRGLPTATTIKYVHGVATRTSVNDMSMIFYDNAIMCVLRCSTTGIDESSRSRTSYLLILLVLVWFIYLLSLYLISHVRLSYVFKV